MEENMEEKKFTAEEVEEATNSVRFSEFQKAIDIIEKGAREDIEKEGKEEIDENER